MISSLSSLKRSIKKGLDGLSHGQNGWKASKKRETAREYDVDRWCLNPDRRCQNSTLVETRGKNKQKSAGKYHMLIHAHVGMPRSRL